MDEEQEKKWTQYLELNAEFHKKVDKIFPRDEHGNLESLTTLSQENPSIITKDEVDEVLELGRHLEQMAKELLLPK